jgi:NAD(P)-dependent dehydrogenase (short-subunit alcohol dehydrogenase family)
VAIRADVADELDVERLFAQTIETFGAIDAVVHSVRGQVVATSVAGAGLDDVDLFGEQVRNPETQERIQMAMSRGLQTRQAEMTFSTIVDQLGT